MKVSSIGCIQYDKDTILKAIYNALRRLNAVHTGVFNMTKIQFWKQFTTPRVFFPYKTRCIQYDKDTILKAIYNWSQIVNLTANGVFNMTKIQFWKQFTTTKYLLTMDKMVYSIWQRYNFESNLQQKNRQNGREEWCIQYDKDTILKAIYNRCSIWILPTQVCMAKIHFIEF